ncbi:hypothetical protein [Streptomyces zaomyceticus]|uniref:hypothetical protein n=1 Tax=Streptomyces zaomyceticus TaxID=68286 RepID=UPI0037990C90
MLRSRLPVAQLRQLQREFVGHGGAEDFQQESGPAALGQLDGPGRGEIGSPPVDDQLDQLRAGRGEVQLDPGVPVTDAFPHPLDEIHDGEQFGGQVRPSAFRLGDPGQQATGLRLVGQIAGGAGCGDHLFGDVPCGGGSGLLAFPRALQRLPQIVGGGHVVEIQERGVHTARPGQGRKSPSERVGDGGEALLDQPHERDLLRVVAAERQPGRQFVEQPRGAAQVERHHAGGGQTRHPLTRRRLQHQGQTDHRPGRIGPGGDLCQLFEGLLPPVQVRHEHIGGETASRRRVPVETGGGVRLGGVTAVAERVVELPRGTARLRADHGGHRRDDPCRGLQFPALRGVPPDALPAESAQRLRGRLGCADPRLLLRGGDGAHGPPEHRHQRVSLAGGEQFAVAQPEFPQRQVGLVRWAGHRLRPPLAGDRVETPGEAVAGDPRHQKLHRAVRAQGPVAGPQRGEGEADLQEGHGRRRGSSTTASGWTTATSAGIQP